MKKIIGFLVLATVFFGMTLSSTRMPAANAASQTDINIAIEKGLAYLNSTQASGGYWAWPYVASTAMAVLSYENAPNNHFAWNLSDPYHTTVQKGFDYLFSTAIVQSIGVEPAGNPDTNGNGFGIFFYDGSGQLIYETPMVLMAIVASQSPAAVATTGPANVIGRTYYDIAVDVVDYLAWAQNEAGPWRGGWRYGPNYSSSDNSVSQWPVLGLGAAELWGINAPAWVKSELLNYWATYDQNLDGTPDTNYYYGAFGYSNPYEIDSIAETAAGIVELTFCGVPKTDARIKAAMGYIYRDWYVNSGWRCNLGNLYAMYAVMKACRLVTPTPAKFIANYTGSSTIEWYNGTGQYADQLISHQGGDGRWNQWYAPESVPTDLATAWGVLILEYVPIKVQYNLTVHVVDFATNNPIAGADVQAEGPDTYLGVTDGSGTVVFGNIQAGTYNVTATMAGYESGFIVTGVTADTEITVKLHITEPPSKLHDVAVIDVIPESSWIYQGKLCHATTNVSVMNEGEAPETFTVTVYADNDTTLIGDEYVVGDQLVADLKPGEYRYLAFSWNTTNVPPCHLYVITAVADVVPYETDIADNTKSGTIRVKVRMLGDTNGDGIIDLRDYYRVALAFGECPGRPRWDPVCDITNDFKVDLKDLYIVGLAYGKTC